jgi:hypothetical protein
LRLEDLGIRISKVKTHDAWKVETWVALYFLGECKKHVVVRIDAREAKANKVFFAQLSVKCLSLDFHYKPCWVRIRWEAPSKPLEFVHTGFHYDSALQFLTRPEICWGGKQAPIIKMTNTDRQTL